MKNTKKQSLNIVAMEYIENKKEKKPYRNKDLFNDIKKETNIIQETKIQENKIKKEAEILNSARYKNLGNDEQKEKYLNSCLNEVEGRLSVKQMLNVLYNLEAFKFISIDEINTNDTKEVFFYDYDTGKYTNARTFKDKIINALGNYVTINQENEIFNHLRKKANIKKINNDPNIINFKNGVFNGNTGEFSEHRNPNIINTRSIAHNYPLEEIQEPRFKKVNSYKHEIKWKPSDIVESFAQGDEKRRKLFFQSIRALLGTERNVFIYIYDRDGGSGKSTIGLLFNNIATKQYTKNVNLNEIGSRFSLGQLNDKCYIYGDELEGNKEITETGSSKFKSLIDNKPIQTEEKGKQATQQLFYGLWIQLGNYNFLTSDVTNGFFRRMKLVNMQSVHIAKEKRLSDIQDKYIKDKRVIQWFIQETLKKYPQAVYEFETPSNNDEEIEKIKLISDELYSFTNWLSQEGYLSDCKKIPSSILRGILANMYDGENKTHLYDKGRIKFNRDIEPYMNNHGFILERTSNREIAKVNVNIKDLPNAIQKLDTINKENYFNGNLYKTFSGVFIRK